MLLLRLSEVLSLVSHLQTKLFSEQVEDKEKMVAADGKSKRQPSSQTEEKEGRNTTSGPFAHPLCPTLTGFPLPDSCN